MKAWLLFFLLVLCYALLLCMEYATHRLQHSSVLMPSQKKVFDRKEIFHAVQITDLHFSEAVDSIETRFSQFLNYTMQQIIRPEYLFITGDLVDAKIIDPKDPLRKLPLHPSYPLENQWKMYHSILFQYASPWMQNNSLVDLKGNHDDYSGPKNDEFYFMYSFSGKQKHFTPLKRIHALPSKDGQAQFIFIDATSPVNYNYPFNFYGLLQPSLLTELEEEVKKLQSENSNLILLSHFPLCSLAEDYNSFPVLWPSQFRELKRILQQYKVKVMLDGHFHRPFFYAKPFGHSLLELQLGDFKFKNYYRIFALDNQLFTFVDTTLDSPIQILITNVKDDTFKIEGEVEYSIYQSQSLRTLLFSTSDVQTVKVWLNNQLIHDLQGKEQVEKYHKNDVHFALFEFPIPSLPETFVVKIKVTNSEGYSQVQQIQVSQTAKYPNIMSDFIFHLYLPQVIDCIFVLLYLFFSWQVFQTMKKFRYQWKCIIQFIILQYIAWGPILYAPVEFYEKSTSFGYVFSFGILRNNEFHFVKEAVLFFGIPHLVLQYLVTLQKYKVTALCMFSIGNSMLIYFRYCIFGWYSTIHSPVNYLFALQIVVSSLSVVKSKVM